MSHDFSYRVISALEAESTVLIPNITPVTHIHGKNSHHKKATKFWSVAASVAAVMFVGVMVMQLQLNKPEKLVPVETAQRAPIEPLQLAPIEIAQSVPTEYLQAHQAAAPNGAAYYIQTASYTEPRK